MITTNATKVIYGDSDLKCTYDQPAKTGIFPMPEASIDQFKSISVGNPDHVWALNREGHPFYWNGSEFEIVPGKKFETLSVGRDGAVWGITIPEKDLVRWNGSEFEIKLKFDSINKSHQDKVPHKLVVGSDTSVWGLNPQGEAVKWIGGFRQVWSKKDGSGNNSSPRFTILDSFKLDLAGGYEVVLGWDKEERKLLITHNQIFKIKGWIEVEIASSEFDQIKLHDLKIVNPDYYFDPDGTEARLIVWFMTECEIWSGSILFDGSVNTFTLSDLKPLERPKEGKIPYRELEVGVDGIPYLLDDAGMIHRKSIQLSGWQKSELPQPLKTLQPYSKDLAWALDDEGLWYASRAVFHNERQEWGIHWVEGSLQEDFKLKELATIADWVACTYRDHPELGSSVLSLAVGLSEDHCLFLLQLRLDGPDTYIETELLSVHQLDDPIDKIAAGIKGNSETAIWVATQSGNIGYVHVRNEGNSNSYRTSLCFPSLMGTDQLLNIQGVKGLKGGNNNQVCIYREQDLFIYQLTHEGWLFVRTDTITEGSIDSVVYLEDLCIWRNTDGKLFQFPVRPTDAPSTPSTDICSAPNEESKIWMASEGTIWALDERGIPYLKVEDEVLKHGKSVLAVFDAEAVSPIQGNLPPCDSDSSEPRSQQGVSHLKLKSKTQALWDKWGFIWDDDSMPYIDEKIGAKGTATLLESDQVLTCAHMIGYNQNSSSSDFRDGQIDLNGIVLIRCFRKYHPHNPYSVVNSRDIYRPVQVEKYQRSIEYDWALLQLDRPVKGAVPISPHLSPILRNFRSVYMLGHPIGLVQIWSSGGKVRQADNNSSYFKATVDAFGGNSGSPVFDRLTHEWIGMLMNGRSDWVMEDGFSSPNRLGPIHKNAESCQKLNVLNHNK
ncbi:trypsin-like peptidase domain-containing protein [Pontibacter sp. G13]|uniref:trypsin-like peptidase domain-containing protein n=1 Tax=Pontibacter sp. G13 TaxID=3074898 RepID=UPI00288BD3A1|nr:trypsin-like peptidase domain-containing protein [Pontibacter sp. G13]WNJ20457.1 trypsin-like peptidase domain-containing protein [Pontibacter sp. G13]